MSDYLSIWIYNSRPRMKVLLCYVLLFLIVFAFSDVMIYLYTKSLYKPMEKYEVNIEAPQVTVNVAEASNVTPSAPYISFATVSIFSLSDRLSS